MSLRSRVGLAVQALRGRIEVAEHDGQDVVDEIVAEAEAEAQERANQRSAEDIPAGPIYSARCIDTEGDVVATRGVDHGQYGPVVAVQVRAGADIGTILLKPGPARAFAAGILNAADEADGTQPLMFSPHPAPESEE